MRKICLVVALGFLGINATPAESADRWNSIAWGAWFDSSGLAHPVVGYAEGTSRKAAEKAALRECKKMGGTDCSTVKAFNSGCYYATVGRRDGGANAGAGATPEAALQMCRSNKEYSYECESPIGGCV